MANKTKSTLRPIWLHSLAAGTWPGQNGVVTIRPEDIQQIAETYKPDVHEAPVVIGHPKTDDPAYGWIRAAESRDDGLWLYADLQPELAEMLDKELYKKLSVSLYPPDATANPVPGSYYLKHLGCLGAQPPAVKGLKAIALDESDNYLTIDFSQEKEPNMGNIKPADKPAVTLSEADLQKKQEQIDLAEADLAKRQKALRRSELESKIKVHVNAGKVLPAQVPVLLELAERCDNQTVSFSEGKEEPLLDAFDKFLGSLNKQVELGELSAPDKVTAVNAVNFAAPSDFDVDTTQMELHKKAEAFVKANPGTTYIQAVQAVKGA